jgi:hypothetical protein
MQQKKVHGEPYAVTHRVETILADNPLQVLELVLERMEIKVQQIEWRQRYGVNEDWHRQHKIAGLYDKGCGCAYCLAVHRYVNVKVSAHRLQCRIDAYDYMCRAYETPESLHHLRRLEEEWPRLRQIKETMRLLAGL